LQQESDRHQDERRILGMADAGVRAAAGQRFLLLRLVKNRPCHGQQPEAADDEERRQQVERPEVGIGLPAEQHLGQMAGIVRKPVDVGEVLGQPAGQQIDRQREAVHLGKERHEECREQSEGAPIPPGRRLEEAGCEENEEGRVDDDERPQPIAGFSVVHLFLRW